MDTDSERPEEEYEHSEPDEEQKTREQLKNKFDTLAARIKNLIENTLEMMEKGKQETINEEVYVNFTVEQDRRFDDELSSIYETIAEAMSGHDYFFRPDLSMPKYEYFKNLFRNLNDYIDFHRNSDFYQGHASKNNKYLYPFFPIHNQLRTMKKLLGGVAGSLRQSGDYFTHPVSISIGSGGGGNGESSEDYYYRTGRQPAREPGQAPAQARYRDIGAP